MLSSAAALIYRHGGAGFPNGALKLDLVALCRLPKFCKQPVGIAVGLSGLDYGVIGWLAISYRRRRYKPLILLRSVIPAMAITSRRRARLHGLKSGGCTWSLKQYGHMARNLMHGWPRVIYAQAIKSTCVSFYFRPSAWGQVGGLPSQASQVGYCSFACQRKLLSMTFYPSRLVVTGPACFGFVNSFCLYGDDWPCQVLLN